MAFGLSSPLGSSSSSVVAHVSNKPKGQIARERQGCRNQGHNEETEQSDREDGDENTFNKRNDDE